MQHAKFSKKELRLLNRKKTMISLLSEPDLKPERAIRYTKYETRIEKLQVEMLKVQKWATTQGQKVVILFEGRDAAGKGGAIRRIVEHLNPREYRIVALPKPNETERGQWYFQRYVNQFPQKGEIVFFDRSYYNRAMVEPVNGFCNEQEYSNFMDQVNQVEKMMLQSGIHLIKFYFSISKNEQEHRFHDIQENPLKKWKYSPVDAKAISLWDEYTRYKETMFEKTQEYVPWTVIKANKKTNARIQALKHILKTLPYSVDCESDPTMPRNPE